MPWPTEIEATSGRFPITPAFRFVWANYHDERLEAATDRALRKWEARTGLQFSRSAAEPGTSISLLIDVGGAGSKIEQPEEDESYVLDVVPTGVRLRAPTVPGAMHGLETLLQLLDGDGEGYFIPAVHIRDQPRFPWRGLLIDVSRHWQPTAVIERNLDAMATVKLNVLHLHLSDDQGFRLESRRHPELQEKGADGRYFTQREMKDLIAYAFARGIRVVPEFDVPGHATSWLASHPELASLPGTYPTERRWGIFDPVLNPTDDRTYALLDDVFGEFAAVFPDPRFHIGGDENNGVQWKENPAIQAFIQEKNLHDNAGLHAFFNRRLSAILAKYGKRMIGWDEIFHPDLPSTTVIQSWRGAEALAETAKAGFSGLLSNGYYIDLIEPAAMHYRNDPVPANTTLTAEQQRRILGGEATMWSEWVSPENIDSRIWPRTAAIAERLWSPRTVVDIPDMYRRLADIGQRLEEAGSLHEKNYLAMLSRLGGDHLDAAQRSALRTFVELVEPVKEYRREDLQPNYDERTPLTGLADCARPDSSDARYFAAQIEALVFAAKSDAIDPMPELDRQLERWIAAARCVAEELPARSPRLRDAAPVAQQLLTAATIGRDALEAWRTGQGQYGGWRTTRLEKLALAAKDGPAAVEIPIIAALRLLVCAASVQPQRATLADAAWRQLVSTLAEPAKP
jgi:hexosaminidase